MISQVNYYIYIGTLLCAMVICLLRFKIVDLPSKILSVLICCAFFNECAAYYLAEKYQNNMSLYSGYSILEFFMLTLYFNYTIDIFKKKRIGLFIGIAGVILGLLNLLFLQSPNTITSYFLLFEALMVIGMSLFAFFRMLLKNDSLNLYKYPHFWLTSILLFFWNVTFFSWGLYDYIIKEFKQEVWTINATLMVTGSVTYLSLGLVFLLYPKMKMSNE